MLFGCIHAFDFPVQALLRDKEESSFISDPIAVLDGREQALKVFALNEAARQEGIYAGMKKRQAEACPGVMLRKRDREQEQAAQAMLLGCGHEFSSHVESTAPGTIITDLTGAERLLGRAAEIAQRLSDSAKACGFQVNVALAGNPDAALHAARGFPGATVISSGEEASCLAKLPVDVLEPGEEILDMFESWGIHTFQALAELPKIPIIQRLGQQGLYLQKLVRGEVQRELVPAEPMPLFQESIDLEEPIELLEPLGVVIDQLLEALMSQLKAQSLALNCVQLDLDLEVHADRQLKASRERELPASTFQRTLKLPVPTQDAKIVSKLLQLDLAEHPPHAAVRKIRVEASPARIRFGQGGLFQALAPEPAKLEITMARLRSVVGEKDEQGRDRVGFAAVMDSHKPDSFQVFRSREEAEAANKASGKTESQTRSLLPLSIFRPPIPAKVFLKRRVPEVVSFEGNRAKVLKASGPWRSSGGWWNTAEKWSQEEWDVELRMKSGIGIYRIVHDCVSENWVVDGMYSSGGVLHVAIMGPEASELAQKLRASSSLMALLADLAGRDS
jgi:protein ImuB